MRWPRICLVPDRIATRMGLTVVAALVGIIGIVALIREAEMNLLWPSAGMEIAGRIAPIVTLVDRTPRSDRAAAAARFGGADIDVQWKTVYDTVGEDKGERPAVLMRHELRDRIGDATAPIHITLGRARAPLHDPGGGPASGPTTMSDVVRIAVGLPDQSWVEVTMTDSRLVVRTLMRYPVPLLVAGIVIALISWRAGRRITAPLARFAAAAERLGTDPDAPPLPETGPREIRDATHAFNRMQTRLKRYVDDRMQMLAAISHDLRTPLTRLRLRVELIEDPETARKVRSDIAEMEAMVDATLTFAREDAQPEARTRVDLAALLQTVCDDLSDTGNPVALGDATRCAVACRPGAMRRALGNVIENAVKYGGRADVRLAVESGHAIVTIDDDGPGIPADELEQVFAPFYRLERSRSRDTGGVGLGLAVAKTIIHAHGGEIQLINRDSGGLRARVSLPLDVPPRAERLDPAAQPVPAAG
jgi:signal transduction histidine kinase